MNRARRIGTAAAIVAALAAALAAAPALAAAALAAPATAAPALAPVAAPALVAPAGSVSAAPALVAPSLVAPVGIAPATVAPAKAVQSLRAQTADSPGTVAYQYMSHLAKGIGRRVTGTAAERRAARYIRESLEALGYSPTLQTFRAYRGYDRISSRNVIATKRGASKKTIVIGAHYDSVSVGRGALDNASGVGLLLALAAELRSAATPYTIVFVAFGCEEVDLNGSRCYWQRLSARQRSRVRLMINFDSVAGGDQWCVYSGTGGSGWPRPTLRRLARSLGLNLRTNPGLGADHPYGTTGDWSDHFVFKQAGVPFAYFETTNWLVGDRNGDINSARYGRIWHTARDTVSWLEGHFPGRMKKQLEASAVVLTRFLTRPIKDL